MTDRAHPPLPRWIRYFPAAVGLCVLAIGAAALIGWWRDLGILTALSPRFVSMKANAAAALALLGLALCLASLPRAVPVRALRALAEIAALALALTTVLEYAANVDLGLDRLLWPAPLNEFQTAAPGRMALPTALALALSAAALIAARWHTGGGRAVSRALATLVSVIGLVALLGYLYGAPQLYRPMAATTAVALGEAISFLLLAAGIGTLQPQYGLPSIALGRTLVGTHVRWLFPAVVLVPLLIGVFAVQTYETFGVARASIALTAAGTTITIGLVVGFAALWLRRMEDRLEVSNRAIAATRQGVFIADGTLPSRPIIYVNEAFGQISGYGSKYALGRSCDFFVKATAEDPALETLASSLGSGESCTVTLPCERQDGTAFSGRLSISVVPGADGAKHLVGALEDVTAEQLAAMTRLQLLAEASQARKEAEAANRVKDVFFASITHELRSPLNACTMWLDVLALSPLSEKSGKAIDAIKRNLKIQARLVNDLIDAAKISSGGIEIHTEPLEIETLIESHVETWKLMAEAREVRFRYRPNGSEERHLLDIDSERVTQVFNNLLENAFRNTPPEGHVELRVEPADDRALSIVIEDSGSGLSAEDLQRVFTPFWRAASAVSRHKGLGLGLAIAEHLVKGHKGTLSARSEGLGKGCVFTVTLPLSESTAEAPADGVVQAH
ncbi:MAG TPA: ATP-binding protein [Gammaproteobacteria bacterium]|nr:ATP-binding protein [Gammaproteobacteria bacterium]